MSPEKEILVKEKLTSMYYRTHILYEQVYNSMLNYENTGIDLAIVLNALNFIGYTQEQLLRELEMEDVML